MLSVSIHHVNPEPTGDFLSDVPLRFVLPGRGPPHYGELLCG